MAIKQTKYPKKASVGEYIEKLEPSYIPGGNVKLTLQKTWYFLKKLNLQLTIWPRNCTPRWDTQEN